tara:strand:+ start:845 stop:970 length:126 start_codon:yes stop_codon:yes gene_type:complete
MNVEQADFASVTGGFETSDGVNLTEALSDGRHALVLLRHFG